jgi:hypothetical protein
MILAKARALYNWRIARALATRDRKQAATRFAAASHFDPGNERYATYAADALVGLESYDAARRLCDSQLKRGDALGYWRHFASFVDELAAPVSEPAGGKRIALFNDTDRRPNIGCRLTSQSFKATIREAFPGCSITSSGFRFSAFAATPPADTDPVSRLETLVATGYGDHAVESIRAADLVLLQPEGSLDADVPLRGLLTFFSPILLASLLGKPTSVLNGTIPAYDEPAQTLLGQILGVADVVAARDRLSADAHAIPFLPDAGLLHEPEPSTAKRDGCLITTGARNSDEQDEFIGERALEICREFNLRPIVLSRSSRRFARFKPEIARLGGIFAETASLDLAAETVSTCRLHVGGRYHMAILALLCGVPALLYDVKTGKNKWLAQYSPLIHLVMPGDALSESARTMIGRAGEMPDGKAALRADYLNALKKAAATPPADRRDAIRAILSSVTA